MCWSARRGGALESHSFRTAGQTISRAMPADLPEAGPPEDRAGFLVLPGAEVLNYSAAVLLIDFRCVAGLVQPARLYAVACWTGSACRRCNVFTA